MCHHRKKEEMKLYDFRFTVGSGLLQALSSQFGKVGADSEAPASSLIAKVFCEFLPSFQGVKLPYDLECNDAVS